MTTRYPSRQELAQHQRPELERLHAQTVFAEYDAPSQAPIDYRVVVGEKGYVAPRPVAGAPCPFLGEHSQFMRQVRQHPTDGLASHYRALRIGIEKGNNVLRELKAAGYILVREEKSTHAAGGRPRKVVVLTPRGTEFLHAYEERTRNV